MKIRALRRGEAGVTLLELVVATAISGVILGVIVGVFQWANKIWQESLASGDMAQNARVAMGLVSRDLQSAVPSRMGTSLEGAFEDDDRPYFHFEGKAESLDLVCFADPPVEVDGEWKSKGGVYWVKYEVQHDEENNLFGLVRKRLQYVKEEEEAEWTEWESVAPAVTAIEFSYQGSGNPNDWDSSWDSGMKSWLPRRVKIILSVAAESAKDLQGNPLTQEYTTMVWLPTANRTD